MPGYDDFGMTAAIAVVSTAVTAGFAWLGLVAFRDWFRGRGRVRAATAGGLGLLGVVAILQRVSEVLPQGRSILAGATIVAFLGSGYSLLLLRDAFIPLERKVKAAAFVLVCIAALMVIAFNAPVSGVPRLQGLRLAGSLLAVGTWTGCVGEPAVRFWLSSASLPTMQQARLRAVSISYVGIAAVLVVSVVSQHEGSSQEVQLGTGLVALMLVPALYFGFVPPPAVRRLWRAREEKEFRRATSELLLHSAEGSAVVEGGLAWALRLLGADDGLIVDSDGQLLAAHGTSQGSSEDLQALVALDRSKRIARVPGSDHFAVVVPLPSSSGEGAVAVLAGPFTPVFAADDLEVLDAFAATLAAAVDRLSLVRDLRTQTSLYESLLGAISDVGEGFAIVEAGRCLYANEAMCRMSGYSEQELIDLPSLAALVAASERELMVDRIARRAQGEAVTSHYDTILLRKDGGTVDIEVAVQPLDVGGDERRFAVIARDVTERKRAEGELRRSEERWRTLAANVPDLILLCDRDGRIDFLNRTVEGFDGASPPVNLFELVAPGHRDELRTLLGAVFDQGRAASFEVAWQGERKPWYSGRMTPIAWDGVVVGATVIARDVTGFKRTEESLRESEAKFSEAYERERAAAEHLRELDEMKNSFLAAVSHELRTPLTSVLGFAVTLERGGERLSEPDRAELTQRLRVNAEKLHQLLSDLLDLDRLNRGILEPTLRPTNLAALVRRVLAESAAWIEGEITMDLGPVVADVDAPKVERITENLLSNAARHSPPGTPLWISLREQDGGALLTVEDAGPGVPPELRDLVFEPFRQGPGVSEHAPGVGIGLSLVAQFTRLHGGRAWVQDRPGGGASFRVWLPMRHPGPLPGTVAAGS